MNEISSQPAPVPAPADRAKVVRQGLATISGWYFGLVAVFGVLLLVSPDEKPPGSGCEGIGWGCTPNPRDSLLLAGVLIGIPFLLGSLVVALVTFGLVVRRFQSGLKAGMVSILAGFFVATAVPLVAMLFL